MPGSLRVETNYSNGATTKTGDGDGDVHLKKPENKDEKHCKDKLQDEPSCDEEFSFSRAFHGVNIRRFSADDSFDFKPGFPIFHENLLFAAGVVDGDCTENMDANDRCPFPGTAKRVFVKMPHINPGNLPAGPGGLTDEAADKKSNLAGFSKIWKFKGLIHRRKSAAVTSAQENYLVRRAMAEERQKAYLAHRTVLVAGGVHSNLGGTAGSMLTRRVHPF